MKAYSLPIVIMLIFSITPAVFADNQIEVEKFFIEGGPDEPIGNKFVRVSSADPYNGLCEIQIKDPTTLTPQTSESFTITLRAGEEREINGLEIELDSSSDIENYRCKLKVKAESSGSGSGGSGSSSGQGSSVSGTPVSIQTTPGSLVHDAGGVVPIGAPPTVVKYPYGQNMYIADIWAEKAIDRGYEGYYKLWSKVIDSDGTPATPEEQTTVHYTITSISGNSYKVVEETLAEYDYGSLYYYVYLDPAKDWGDTILVTVIAKKSNGASAAGSEVFVVRNIEESTAAILPRQITIDSADNGDIRIGDAYYLGNKNAPVIMIEYGDFEDPFTAQFYEQTLPKLQKEYIGTGKLAFAFKHMPLSFHPNAEKAAEATECAGIQGSFWDMHDIVLENQENLEVTDLKEYAEKIDLNVEHFVYCLDNGDTHSKIASHIKQANEFGVFGTPTFFINGYKITGALPYEVFEAAIEKALGYGRPVSNLNTAQMSSVVAYQQPEQRLNSCATDTFCADAHVKCKESGTDEGECEKKYFECVDEHPPKCGGKVGQVTILPEFQGSRCQQMQKQCEEEILKCAEDNEDDTVCRIKGKECMAKIFESDCTQRTPHEGPAVPAQQGFCYVNSELNTYVPIGTRLLKDGIPVYCGIYGKLELQRKDKEEAQNNFECKSNFASDGSCVSVSSQLNLLQRIWSFLSRIF